MNPGRPDRTPITSPRSERVRTIAVLSGRPARRKQGRFRAEGPQAVRSLLTHRPGLVTALYLTPRAAHDHPELEALAAAAGIEPMQVDEAVVRAMTGDGDPAGEGTGEHRTGSTTPQGVVAVGRTPGTSDGPGEDADLAGGLAALPATGPVTVVVLHEVRDPGNVGTLVRTADAAGADLVVLTRSSADPWSPKALRAAAGSTFHLPVLAGADAADLSARLTGHGVTAVATSGHAAADLFDTALPERLSWWFGNEARGLDEGTLAAADLRVRIPLAGHAESLNVHTAATVCLFESLRRRSHRAAS